jgi:hypothetical protein
LLILNKKHLTMKKSLLVMAIAAFASSTEAQDTSMVGHTQDTSMVSPTSTYGSRNSSGNKTFIWSIGIEPSIPFGHFNRYSGFGLGGSLQGELKPGKVGITLNVGYLDYFGKTVDTVKYSDFKYWPVMAGLKFYLSKNTYIHPQAGAGFGSKGLGTSFWYGAGIGFNLSKAIDVEFKYTGWKQSTIAAGSTTGGGIYGGSTGGTGGTGGGYGGHYPTIGVRLAYNF